MNPNDPLTIAGAILIGIAFIAIEAVVRHRRNGGDPR